MNWISVKDKLPEFHEQILLCTKMGRNYFVDYGRLHLINGNGAMFRTPCRTLYPEQSINTIDKKQRVTHWMPLPEPPKQ